MNRFSAIHHTCITSRWDWWLQLVCSRAPCPRTQGGPSEGDPGGRGGLLPNLGPRLSGDDLSLDLDPLTWGSR